ncbi:MAG: hypothetical protein CL908_25220, partial [Deltaproteobacteria bacterium]|nr:hypothetical protein [Deltaproteobacteria bacterium]
MERGAFLKRSSARHTTIAIALASQLVGSGVVALRASAETVVEVAAVVAAGGSERVRAVEVGAGAPGGVEAPELDGILGRMPAPSADRIL